MDWHTKITENKLIFENDEAEVLAMLEFEVEEDTFVVTHTNVNPSLRGHGIAACLMEEFCQYAKQENKKIQPVCTYAVAWLEQNPR